MKLIKRKKVHTESIAAYRKADNEAYKCAPDVVGYRINLSNNHPIKNLCDDLIGVYPTWFRFIGHDDECMCFVTPEIAPDEEFDEYLEAVRNGTDDKFEFKGTVTTLPANFTHWVRINNYFLDSWESAPIMITDNFTKKDIRSQIDGKKPSFLNRFRDLGRLQNRDL